MPGRSEREIRPFGEARDPAEFMTPEALAAARRTERQVGRASWRRVAPNGRERMHQRLSNDTG